MFDKEFFKQAVLFAIIVVVSLGILYAVDRFGSGSADQTQTAALR